MEMDSQEDGTRDAQQALVMTLVITGALSLLGAGALPV